MAEAGHVGDMLKSVPFVPEMTGAIRAAWDPDKASGPHRRLLLFLCQALAPYLRDYPGFIALFDELPEFASEFSKTVLGFGASKRSRSSTSCHNCEESISTKDADLRDEVTIHHSIGALTALDGSLEKWYCSKQCYEDENHTRINHDHCEICKREEG